MSHVFGAYLRELRKARGLSPTELAACAKLSRATVYNWESGSRLPRISELEAVMTALNVSRRESARALKLLPAPRAKKRLRELDRVEFDLPHGGDLLRALRNRLGWSQERTASRLGVNQATLARWERGDVWPNCEMVQAVCQTLQARRSEYYALTSGHFSFGAPVEPIRSTDLETLNRSLNVLLQRLADEVNYGLGDLMFLTLEANAASAAKRSQAGCALLARIYIEHARYLSERCQPREAGISVTKALPLLTNNEYCTDGMLMRIELYRAVWRYPIQKHDAALRHWLGRDLSLSDRSVVTGQIAAALAEKGHIETSISLKSQILQIVTEQGEAWSQINRGNCLAEALLLAGRAAEAADLLQVSPMMSPPMQLRTLLKMVEANIAAGRSGTAHNVMQLAIEKQSALAMAYYQPEIDELAVRL